MNNIDDIEKCEHTTDMFYNKIMKKIRFRDIYNIHTKKYIIDNGINEFLTLTKKKTIKVGKNSIEEDRECFYLTLKNKHDVGYHYYLLGAVFDSNVVVDATGRNVFTKSSIGYEFIRIDDLKNVVFNIDPDTGTIFKI